MWLLIAAVLALLAGPLFIELGQRGKALRQFIGAFVFVAVALLLLHDLLPELGAQLGGTVWLLCLAGVLLPLLADHGLQQGITRVHRTLLVIGVAGLMLHGLTDGLLLAGAADADAHAGEATALAVVLHNLPKGMAVWLLLVPAFGRAMTSLLLAGLPLAMVLGYLAAAELAAVSNGIAAAGLQAFLAGTLLHVMFHDAGGITGLPLAARLGILAGLLLLLL
jgi:uncharacterized protein